MFAALILVVGIVGVTVEGAADLDWYRSALVYQIYPRSFKDSNGDGIGDLNGVTSKLQYLKDTGVDVVWLSPIYLSPMYDFGYDITDYRQIAPEYGTMEDFDNLMKHAKELGVRVILDFVPNHTSNESDWFVKSVRREPGYEDYYVWENATIQANSTTRSPPNNWISNFRKSAWEWNEVRGQYYLHQFVIGQPDLNYRNEKVREEMKNVLRFWMDKGVSGFRVDAINTLFEVDKAKFGGKYPDEPRSNDPTATPDDYNYLSHIYTLDQNETYDVVYDWRDVLNEYIPKHSEFKVMMTEAYSELGLVMKYYGSARRKGSVPFNFKFLGDINNQSNAVDISQVIYKWMDAMPKGDVANWVNGNHDQSRLASRHGTDRIDAMNMLALLLPGITLTYQGEEIGMTDGFVSWQDTVDPQACNTDDPINYYKKSRDPNRTPYHWDATENAGFSTTKNKTWLPVADNYKTLNLAAQINASKSHYTFYKDVAAVKKSLPVKAGDLYTVVFTENILAVVRVHQHATPVIGLINLGDEETINLSRIPQLPDYLEVVASGVDSTLVKGEVVMKTSVHLSARSAVVLHARY